MIQQHPTTVGLRPVPKLTARRLQIMRLAASGLENTEIADRLCLSSNTIKTQLAHTFRILRARNRQHAVALCLRYELITVDDLRPFSLPPAPARPVPSRHVPAGERRAA